MPVRRRVMNLQGRRQDLGATVKQMAAGLGMGAAEIVSIEKGRPLTAAPIVTPLG